MIVAPTRRSVSRANAWNGRDVLNGVLVGRSRPIGDDQAIALSDIAMTGNVLSYKVMISNPVPVHLTFDGVKGSGTWGDGGVQRGGAATSIKRR